MKLTFTIEYRTAWGEALVLRLGDRRIAMRYADGGVWSAEVDDLPAGVCEYGYEVERDGRCVRREWRSHTLELPAGASCVGRRDLWQDRDDEAPFYASAFTRGIFSRDASSAPQTTEGWTLCVACPTVRPDEVLAIAGNGRELDDWRRIVPLSDGAFPEWSLTLAGGEAIEYKLLVADRRTLEPRLWEEGGNRRCEALPRGESRIEELRPRFAPRHWRGAGTAIPVFSLRTEEDFGIGEFLDLKQLVDWAAATGQRILQLLPINDTTITGTWEDSYPYNANSSFALHPQFIRLTEAGVEADAEYRGMQAELNALAEVDYERVNAAKEALLRRAYAQHGARTAASDDYRAFVEANRSWLVPYAVFRSLRDRYATADFSQWGEMAQYDDSRVEAYCRQEAGEVGFHCYVQYHLHLQLSEVCRYAHAHGVVLKGDLPIGVSRTSADAWRSPELFHMDSQAGAPPDAFAAMGQNWGFPTYNWERMARDGYAWWCARLKKMAEYFDAYRIDHILGFFRIWEIPAHAVHGLLGHFNPALPYSADELRAAGFDTSGGRYARPETWDWVLDTLFGPYAGEVRATCLCDGRLRPEYATQRQIVARIAGDDERSTRIREGLMALLADVLFVEDPRREGHYHPRIGAQHTLAYRALDDGLRRAFDRLHDDFFFRRHNDFWRESALRKLPAILSASGMLTCGEDLGMIPDSVPATMHELRILSLEIQRMPKSPDETFASPARYPYLSVCTTSTHDMNPLRAWWREDRPLTERFYGEVLGERGEAPADCTPELCRRIVEMHLASPAMLVVLPWQDWMSTDGALRLADPERERINVPAIPRYYWRYRMHLTVERLLGEEAFNAAMRAAIAGSGRS